MYINRCFRRLAFTVLLLFVGSTYAATSEYHYLTTKLSIKYLYTSIHTYLHYTVYYFILILSKCLLVPHRNRFLIYQSLASESFVVFGDLHYDQTYDTNQAESCYEGLTPAQKGLYGSYYCDSPMKLLEATMNAIKDVVQDSQFIVWGG